jgi:hypothetical protein
LNLFDRRWLAYLIDQESGKVGLRAGQVTNELQKADDLAHPQGPALVPGVLLESLADVVDVPLLLGREIPFHQLKHLVQRDQRTNRLLGELRPG